MPYETVDLGAVGYLRNGVFERRQDLTDFGVAFQSRTESNTARFTYQSSSGVSVTWKAKGQVSDAFQVVGSARAGALVKFSREGAALLAASPCTVTHMTDMRGLERQLRRLEDWDRRYVVVTSLVAAEQCTVLVASGREGHVELEGAAGSTAISGLAELSSAVAVVSSSGVAVEIVAQGGLTPLYKVHEFRQPLVGTPTRRRGQLRISRKATARATAAKE